MIRVYYACRLRDRLRAERDDALALRRQTSHKEGEGRRVAELADAPKRRPFAWQQILLDEALAPTNPCRFCSRRSSISLSCSAPYDELGGRPRFRPGTNARLRARGIARIADSLGCGCGALLAFLLPFIAADRFVLALAFFL